CCIYRVPQSRRGLYPRDYTPQIVSIGPLHHGNEELKAMENNKTIYLHYFLEPTKVSMPYVIAFIREREVKLRNYYADTIYLGSDEFVTMILLDAVFLIELFLGKYKGNFRTDDDPLFRESGLSFLGIQVRYDLYLEENQLPLFILREFEFNYQNIPGIKELHQAGVKFESGSRTQNLPKIKFNNGILVIPFFTAFSSHTECLYRYVPAFENMHGCPRNFNDYFAIMYFLLRTPIDADILIQNGIIGLGDREILSAALKRLRKYTLL
ncbi:hypothetical protein CICLE_v10018034mg, partial [Citrus x clementina]